MNQQDYLVEVTREGEDWLADVPGLQGAHTFARSLQTLDRYVREVIVLAADLPDDAADSLRLDWRIDTGDVVLDDQLEELRRERQRLNDARHRVEHDTAELAGHLGHAGFSVRDVAVLTGLSRARAQQLTGRKTTRTTDLTTAKARGRVPDALNKARASSRAYPPSQEPVDRQESR